MSLSFFSFLYPRNNNDKSTHHPQHQLNLKSEQRHSPLSASSDSNCDANSAAHHLIAKAQLSSLSTGGPISPIIHPTATAAAVTSSSNENNKNRNHPTTSQSINSSTNNIIDNTSQPRHHNASNTSHGTNKRLVSESSPDNNKTSIKKRKMDAAAPDHVHSQNYTNADSNTVNRASDGTFTSRASPSSQNSSTSPMRKRPQNPLLLRSKDEPEQLTTDQQKELKEEFASHHSPQQSNIREAKQSKLASNGVSTIPSSSNWVRKELRNEISTTLSGSISHSNDPTSVNEPRPTSSSATNAKSDILSLTSSSFKSVVQDIRKQDEIAKGTIIKNRYRITSQGIIGSGSFGAIYEVEFLRTGAKYALKVISPRFKAQAKSEKKHLLMLSQYERHHVIRFEESFIWQGKICFIFELLSHSLFDLIQHTNYKGLKLKIVQIIGRQLLKSLIYLSSMGIIHADLKPENILLCPIKERHFREEHLRIKIIDFGSACHVTQGPFIRYIQSRFYRAPEVILEMNYSSGIDLWSLGCILFELHMGVPLFDGENEADMISMMVSCLGMPPTGMLKKSEKTALFFDYNSETDTYSLKSSLVRPSETLQEKLGLNTEDGSERLWKGSKGYKRQYYEAFHQVLQNIFQWNPKKRDSLTGLLRMPFFTMKFGPN